MKVMSALAVESPPSTRLALTRLHATMKAAFDRDGAPTYEHRREALRRILALVNDHEQAFIDAMREDYGHRSPSESLIGDLYPSAVAAKHALWHLRSWMRPQRHRTSLALLPSTASVVHEPLGVIGVIAPWNYPVYMAMHPLIEALAAGNRVMLKPSELTPRTSQLLTELLHGAFPDDEVRVVQGGPDVGAEFSRLPFDHLFFTGSTAVGRIVLRAAADHLVPVTLELGGKSPVLIQRDYPVDDAAAKITFGKLLNAGQLCVAPDYVLVHESRKDAMVAALERAMARSFPTIANNDDYTCIINARHYDRLCGYVREARELGARVIEVKPAGEVLDPARRKLAPTLLLDVPSQAQVLQEEIFGPLLPIVTYRETDEALAFINARPKPLAFYCFDTKRRRAMATLARTSSGGAVVNDVLLHIAQEDLPFGGVGPSGMGNYHGFAGFKTFSNARGIMHQSRFALTRLFRPPYSELARRLARWLMR